MQNVVAITGRLTHDIELKTFENGNKAANFSLAVQRNYKNKDGEYDCDFINCQASNHNAEFLAKYFAKGQMVVCSGELRTRKYTTESGENRTVTYVLVNSFTFVGGKKDSGGSAPAETAVETEAEKFPEYNDDDLPF